MTNLEWIKQATAEELSIELVCNKFNSAVAAKQWLQSERMQAPVLSMEEILELKFFSSDLCEIVTVRTFLKTLLSKLLGEKEMFNSKRPFGNSDWDSDLIILFVKNHIISGRVGVDRSIEYYNENQFNLIIQELIKEL